MYRMKLSSGITLQRGGGHRVLVTECEFDGSAEGAPVRPGAGSYAVYPGAAKNIWRPKSGTGTGS